MYLITTKCVKKKFTVLQRELDNTTSHLYPSEMVGEEYRDQ